MSPGSLLFVYCVFIFAASNAGGRLSDLIRMTHLRTQLLMSGVAGLMLGIAMLHLLPHAGEILQSSTKTGAGSLLGLIAMFLLIRLFHTHDHSGSVARPAVTDAVSEDGLPSGADDRQDHSSHHDHDHDHAHDHDHDHDGHGHHDHDHHAHAHLHSRIGNAGHSHDHTPTGRRFGWAGVFFGLTLHTLIDGVALASSVIADASHGSSLGLAGIGTFLVIVLHIPLDSFAITSVMSRQGWSSQAQRTASLLFSLACPIGAACFYLGVTRLIQGTEILGWGLAISAGFFICIALADLLPEVAFHDHDRGKLTAALLFGVAIAVTIENLPGHNHDHGSGESSPGEHGASEPHIHQF
ncbi:ZIP family metal transporter [Roseiconus nitratireducens]|nr:ZIP family metal transporter [Roseiconus nitratireducens]